jgi:hypothetical protein
LIWSDNAQKISKSNSKAYRDHIKINPQSIKPTLNNIYKKKPQNHHKITTKSLKITQNHSKSTQNQLKITRNRSKSPRNRPQKTPKTPKIAPKPLKNRPQTSFRAPETDISRLSAPLPRSRRLLKRHRAPKWPKYSPMCGPAARPGRPE